MKRKKLEYVRWGAMWHLKNQLDGEEGRLMFRLYLPVLFVTKKEATQYIKEKYGYIAKRKDLRNEPHGWRMPKPVRVKISMLSKEE